jgi:hypothetical protein
MTQDETVALVRDRYDVASKEQKSKFDKFSDFDFIFNNKLKFYDPNIPSKVFNPIVWSFIETIITRMLAKTPTIAYKPREETDADNSQIFSDLFSYWFDKCNVYPKMVSWVKSCLIHGTSVVKIDWYTSKPREVISYVFDTDGTPKVDKAGKFLTETRQVIDYDDPRIKNVNIYDFFIDPSATSIDDAQWVVYQYWANLADLEQENEAASQSGQHVYKKYQLDAIKREKSQDYNDYEARRREATGLDSVKADDKTVDRCLIWEMWENDRLIVIADGMKVIRDTKNPYWHGKKPFVYLVDSIQPDSFWGKGEIEPVEKLIHALNTTQNQRITNVNRILSPTWKAKPNVDDDELNFVDNGIIHVNDMQDTEILTIPDVTSKSYQEGEAIKEDVQRALGVTDYTQGLQTPGQTAAEVETKTAQSNARFAHKVKLFEEMGLKEVGTMVYQLYQQYVTKERVVRIVGKKGEQYITATPQDLVGEYDAAPESQSTLATDSEAEFAKFFNLFTVMRDYVQKQLPGGVDPKTGQMILPQTTGFINEQELVMELIKRSGEKDPEKFLANQGNEGDNGQGQTDQTVGPEAQVPPGPTNPNPAPWLVGMGGQDQARL